MGGYGLLLLLGRGTAFGLWLNETLGVRLLFTWQGAALAASVMALPLFVRTVAAALASVEVSVRESARLDGAGGLILFLRVLLPLSAHGLRAGLLLGAARALGEFGATLMVAGSIPGKTQTLPLTLYNAVQSGDDPVARGVALCLAALAFLLVWAVGRSEAAQRSW